MLKARSRERQGGHGRRQLAEATTRLARKRLGVPVQGRRPGCLGLPTQLLGSKLLLRRGWVASRGSALLCSDRLSKRKKSDVWVVVLDARTGRALEGAAAMAAPCVPARGPLEAAASPCLLPRSAQAGVHDPTRSCFRAARCSHAPKSARRRAPRGAERSGGGPPHANPPPDRAPLALFASSQRAIERAGAAFKQAHAARSAQAAPHAHANLSASARRQPLLWIACNRAGSSAALASVPRVLVTPHRARSGAGSFCSAQPWARSQARHGAR